MPSPKTKHAISTLGARDELVETATRIDIDGFDVILLSHLHADMIDSQLTGIGEWIGSITLLPGPIGTPPTIGTNNIIDINLDDFWLV